MRPPSISVVTAASGEPITLAEARLHCRVDGDEENDILDRCITTARMHVEQVTSARLRSEVVDLYYDAFPRGALALPIYPATEITSITYYDTSDSATVWSSSYYQTDLDSTPQLINPKYGYQWPSITLRPMRGVKIRATVGYSSIPVPLKSAVLMLVASLYENRQTAVVEPGALSTIIVPFGFDRLIQDYTLYPC